jgi:hypothetical protein
VLGSLRSKLRRVATTLGIEKVGTSSTGRSLLADGLLRPKGELPYQDLTTPLKRIILDACRMAWIQLEQAAMESGTTIDHLSEDDITANLKEHLNAIRTDPREPVQGFTPALFETVVRDANVATFDGSNIEKRPDLVFRLVELNPGMLLCEYRGLFTECKIVDSQRHPIGLYCSKGIARFVCGDYGWAMPSGLMLCYRRENRTVESTLKPALRRARRQQKTDPYRTRKLPNKADELGVSPSAFVSVHKRPWRYPGGGSPSEIALIHLWLS